MIPYLGVSVLLVKYLRRVCVPYLGVSVLLVKYLRRVCVPYLGDAREEVNDAHGTQDVEKHHPRRLLVQGP